MSSFPQRHRFAVFAAIAEREAKDNAALKGYSEGYDDTRLPQRHRFAVFAAVAEREEEDNAAQKGYSEGNGDMRFPQRHRFAGFAAAAEREEEDNAALKGYSEGNGGTRLPQRHRNTGFAAIAEGLSIFADEYGTERRDTGEHDTGKCGGPLSGIHRAGPLAENADGRIHRRLPGLREGTGILP